MKLVRAVRDLDEALEVTRRAAQPIGFVPTMGALHEGHLSLMRRAREQCAAVVASIFVNPLQFGPNEDFARYPRDLDRDHALCARAGVDVLFAPEVETIYPAGFSTGIEVAGISDVFEGKIRPGHFRGVATVVLKLLNLVRPDRAYFGQKDFQQTVVVRRLVRDLAVRCTIEVEPTIREPDELAMSSRNVYLRPPERSAAPVLYQSLRAIAGLAEKGEKAPQVLRQAGLEVLAQAPLVQLDYLEVVSTEDLQPLPHLDREAVALIAAHIGATRLIDNLILPTE